LEWNSFGVIGGDQRQIALAESMAADGYTVYAYGFDKAAELKGVRPAELRDLALVCDTIVLPLPVTRDGQHLNTPLGSELIPLDEEFAQLMRNRRVFGGMMDRLYQTSELWQEIDTRDYFAREELAVRNAALTAEGSIEIAMKEYPGAIGKSRCLVAGFGRIGKALAHMLRGLGARVSVSARRPEDFAWIEVYGYEPVHTGSICQKEQYDIIFNTIPARVFTRRVLSAIPTDTILIDLASAPGGVDTEAAEKLGIHVIPALSLPGKAAPKAAGEVIKGTIYNMMEE
jgi:dipicolinate synthase subunit A